MSFIELTSPEALAEAHRIAQARLGAEVILRMTQEVWVLLDPDNLAGTTGRWLRAAQEVIESARRQSAILALDYVTALGHIDPTLVTPGAALADALDFNDLRPSLLVTGPGRLATAIKKGVPPERAAANAQASSARSAQRMVLNGGRETILKSSMRYRRVTSPTCCAFCAMLASRGVVYHSRESAGFEAHDGCNCWPEPAARGSGATELGDEFGEQYDEAQKLRKSGDLKAGGKNPALNAFRTLRRRQS